MANFHVIAGPDETLAHPNVRTIGTADLRAALARGVDDFKEMPTHLIFLGLIYPLFGIAHRITSAEIAVGLSYGETTAVVTPRRRQCGSASTPSGATPQ